MEFFKNGDDLKLDNILKIEENNNKTCSEAGFVFDKKTNSCQPINTIKSCNIENGIGIQKWRGDKWTKCSVDKCNEGYITRDGIKCIGNTSEEIECNIGNNWCKDKEEKILNCNINEHLENNICIKNTKNCNIANGVGEQTWNGNIFGSCIVKPCNDGYENKNGVCINNNFQINETDFSYDFYPKILKKANHPQTVDIKINFLKDFDYGNINSITLNFINKKDNVSRNPTFMRFMFNKNENQLIEKKMTALFQYE